VRQFELIFAVDDLSDETVDHIYKDYDALVSAHSGQALLTVTAEGATPLLAAKSVVTSLERIPGVNIRRCHIDVDSQDLDPISATDLSDINHWLTERQTH
jgi:hypothetical protein